IAARRKSLPWQLFTIALFLSLLSMIILQRVAAEPAYYSRSLDSFPILPTSLIDNSNGLLGSFERSYFPDHKGKLWQETVKPVLREAQDNQLSAGSSSANENAVETHVNATDSTISWVLLDSEGRQYYLEVTGDEYARNVTT